MPAFVRKGGAWKTALVFVKKAGVWKEAAVSVKKSGAWKDALEALVCEVDVSSFTEYVTDTSATTATATVTPSGGASPYTYSWTRDSGSALISADSASAAATTFSLAGASFGSTYEAIFRCTVTDDNGETTFALVSVFFQVDYPS